MVTPLIIIKQNTNVAIYGLGYIKDHRLNYLMSNNKIRFQQPEDELNGTKQYFNILVVH